MVHRIHNRNPGYSDFSNIGSSASFNFSNTTSSSPITHGANALKLENEIVQEQQSNTDHTNVTNEEVLQSSNTETESIIEDTSVNEMEKSFTQEAIETQDETNVSENTEEYMAMTSRIVHLVILDVLATGFILRKGPDFLNHMEKINRSLKPTRYKNN